MCFRNLPHAEVNDTGHLESFHNRLKKFYLKRKVNKRLDDLIQMNELMIYAAAVNVGHTFSLATVDKFFMFVS